MSFFGPLVHTEVVLTREYLASEIRRAVGLVAHIAYISESRIYVAPEDGLLEIFAGAAGGSGAAAFGNNVGNATGGGAGEMGIKRLWVTKGQEFTVLVPAPGQGVRASSLSTLIAGRDGSDMTISTPAWTGVLKGGHGGQVAAGSNVCHGGMGGTGGTGFDLHMPGSRGGSVLGAVGNTVTGGGAANPCGHPPDTGRGGDVIGSGKGTNTGGGGVGGSGGDKTNTGSNVTTAGGGYGGPAAENVGSGTAYGANAAGVKVQGSPKELIPAMAAFGLDYFGGGTASNSGIPSGPGGGSGGDGINSNTPPGAPGIFGGSGAVMSGTAGERRGADAGLCAGSGAGRAFSTNTVETGAGGVGIAVFILRRAA